MNQIELVTRLPDLSWSRHSEEEITITGQELIDMSDFIWQIRNVAVAGFVYYSFTSPPWMWFVLADNVTVSDLLDFRRLARGAIPIGTMTAVAADFPVGLRFAKLHRFEPTGETRDYHGREYLIMRKN